MDEMDRMDRMSKLKAPAFASEKQGPQIDAEPVSRILYGVAAVNGHSSRPAIAGQLKRPTRKFDASSRDVFWCFHQNSSPIWPCSAWGLPCPGHYCPSGALLPHLFTLTRRCRQAVSFLWHFPSNALQGTPTREARVGDPAGAPSRTLSGTLLCGVRTFLSPSRAARTKIRRSREDSDHPVRHQLFIIIRCKAPGDTGHSLFQT
jgi:hypothetical protein